MRITVNGKDEIVEKGMTVAKLIALKKINPSSVIIEYNQTLAKRKTWDNIILQENDSLEILRFVGGG
ncbi:MAG: sulfur carrier protein ThiS [Peptococcaceae bacterium]|nr:sulfur carrier protein ThiS [Candidatus Syntrophopropionicum ammoniitolerans]